MLTPKKVIELLSGSTLTTPELIGNDAYHTGFIINLVRVLRVPTVHVLECSQRGYYVDFAVHYNNADRRKILVGNFRFTAKDRIVVQTDKPVYHI